MFNTFYIKPNERGLLFHRSDLQAILLPGSYRRMGWHWSLQAYDLNQPEVELAQLPLLLQTQATLIHAHFTVVQTDYHQAALVQLGNRWLTVLPNQIKAFWQGFIPVETFLFSLRDGLTIPAEFVPQIQGQTLVGVLQVHITESEIGMLYHRDNFIQPLEPGDYAFWNLDNSIVIRRFDRTDPCPDLPFEDILMAVHPALVESYCQAVHLNAQEIGIVRHKGKAIAILPPCSQRLFWRGVSLEVLDIQTDYRLSAAHCAELVASSDEVLTLALPHLHTLEVPAQHVGLLYLNGVLQETFPAGLYAWWTFGRKLRSTLLDLRLQLLEVSGQEILTKDKVSLRLNLTAGFKIVDPVQATQELADIEGYLYKELQFALRAAVGTRNLDALLENKEAIDASVFATLEPKALGHGIRLESVGVKDIILPGEMKTILGRVVEAEKAAQANVIRRREETAATRSMLNTARVMEDSPIALRLKELEILERIAEKIEHIHVNGSLDSILTQLIRLRPESQPGQGLGALSPDGSHTLSASDVSEIE
jgi:regulator of protease activity HflC (stomatin/prohibitin superfamily)